MNKSLSSEVINIMNSGEKNRFDRVSELLVKEFLKSNYIYATREDVSPELWIYKDGIWIPKGKTYIQEFCRGYLEEYHSGYIISRVITKIRDDCFIDPDKFFGQPNLTEIPVMNGVLNLETRKLREYSHNDLFFHKMPVNYNPEAVCPAIDKHFEEVLKNPSDSIVMYEIIGYCLESTHFIEKAFMFVGDGRNGKGKSLEIIKKISWCRGLLFSSINFNA